MTDAEKVAHAADNGAYRIANLIPAKTVAGEDAALATLRKEIAETMKALSAEIRKLK